MSWTHISTEKISAPRNLTRKHNKPDVIETMFGPYDRTPQPSVGGAAEASHDIWRCSSCRAWAVTATGTKPGKCLKCKV